QDVLLVASIERHRATGQVGLGLVTGFALKRGALGSSVAHDSHNLILVGTSPGDMVCCARQLHRMGGGFVVTADGRTLAQLPLPIAGLLSPEPAGVLAGQLDQLHRAARSLGCTLPAPFGTLSFLALSVIPELRITDQGLFDVGRQQFVAPG
ncbi:MAG TPA: adenine deaminase, partial [Planctomycetaceae bacterium]|nr:adenine deaminase [Planctomycetaceae bacterium]